MKTYFTLALLLALLPLQSFAQDIDIDIDVPTIPEAEVPQVVLDTQAYFFPSAFITEWQKEEGFDANEDDAVRYIAKFERDGKAGFSASYLPSGELIFQNQYMPPENIPETVRLKLQFEFKNFEIDHANFLTVYSPKREIYEVRIRENALVQQAYYDINGNRIDKSTLPPEVILFTQ
ncbi:MAG: hypothetical protein CMC08_05035 [Flavobacteriaceae bacterium]|nr:hypothetical protein [Flavobacteriaceae bacterium]